MKYEVAKSIKYLIFLTKNHIGNPWIKKFKYFITFAWISGQKIVFAPVWKFRQFRLSKLTIRTINVLTKTKQKQQVKDNK